MDIIANENIDWIEDFNKLLQFKLLILQISS